MVDSKTPGASMTRAKSFCAFIVFTAAFAFYSRNAAPSVTAGDSGEFITAAATLSLPHSPSFPLYVIASRCFVSAVPFGSIPYRCNLFSALTSAFTLLLLFLIACSPPLVLRQARDGERSRTVGGVRGGESLTPSFVVTLLLAFSGSFWENSLVTEVFSLNILLAVLVTWALLKTDEAHFSLWWLATFFMGLGLGNHQVLMFVAPLFAVVGWLERRWIWRRAIIVGAIVFFILGFSIYLVLPIRSQAKPPLNWGQPTSVMRLTHSILRKDYGTMTLALGEKPDRSLSNSARHVAFFARHIASEVSWPLFVLGFLALGWGAWRRDHFSLMMLSGFLFSGPLFIWLGNLPLTAQSEGIIGRFLILPAFFLIGGFIPVLRQFKIAGVVLGIFAIVELSSGWTLASDYRNGFLVLDYGNAMLRSLPMNAALFMDGGDDAFYSLAMLQNVLGKRADVELHDRGGLVFPNPYGDDFRSLTKDQKSDRRWAVEKIRMQQKPVYYVTMDPHVLPGVDTALNGILMQTTPVAVSLWPFYALRSLYPPEPATFRMRALAAFFPFAYAGSLENSGHWQQALIAYDRALEIGDGADWLQTNISYEFGQWGYRELIADRLAVAEAIYRRWIALEPMNMQAQSNFGVVLEKQGRVPEAQAQYERTAVLFPTAADPVFNLSVLAWKRGDWPEVVRDLEEVLRRNPQHPQAPKYLMQARMKLSGSAR